MIKHCLNLVVTIDEDNSVAEITEGTFKRPCRLCNNPDCFFGCRVCNDLVNDYQAQNQQLNAAARQFNAAARLSRQYVIAARQFNTAAMVLERLVETHAGMGIDIESQGYQQSIQNALITLELSNDLQIETSVQGQGRNDEVIEGEPEDVSSTNEGD